MMISVTGGPAGQRRGGHVGAPGTHAHVAAYAS